MKIKAFHFNPLQVNCYVCYDANECIIIDPACTSEIEYNQLFDFIEKENLVVKHIVITHPHIDHIVGSNRVCKHYDLPLTMHKDGEEILKMAPLHAMALGMKLDSVPENLTFIDENDTIKFGESLLRIVYTPGHADGSICLIDDVEKTVFTGDVLFNGSIGRTDLVTGDFQKLIQSIQTKLLILSDDYIVRPGHGGRTSIGNERLNNPYF
ncbi:MBL fold metallo-hydrolase [Bacteroidia bacterium]|nr:MBL fold metallo-hydrolase [Bacteroidia bacterium]